MHDDDRRWLRHPVLPRPPTVPYFGPELGAIIGLDPVDFEPGSGTSEPSSGFGESEVPTRRGHLPYETPATSELVESGKRAESKQRMIRTGT
jgi:hypothetical protein